MFFFFFKEIRKKQDALEKEDGIMGMGKVRWVISWNCKVHQDMEELIMEALAWSRIFVVGGFTIVLVMN